MWGPERPGRTGQERRRHGKGGGPPASLQGPSRPSAGCATRFTWTHVTRESPGARVLPPLRRQQFSGPEEHAPRSLAEHRGTRSTFVLLSADTSHGVPAKDWTLRGKGRERLLSLPLLLVSLTGEREGLLPSLLWEFLSHATVHLCFPLVPALPCGCWHPWDGPRLHLWGHPSVFPRILTPGSEACGCESLSGE